MSTRITSLLVFALVLACASPESAPPQTPVATTSATAPEPLPAGALRFAVVPQRSIATIRVREQIAGIAAPGDAVLTTPAFTGTFVLLPDGTFARGSTIAVELDTLRSDSELRDEWIKVNTLQTRTYPRAEFELQRVVDVPLPLPPDGDWSARIEGIMRIHGVERPLTWPLRALRSAGDLRVQGETTFRFGDYGMAVPANRLILSVVDEIRLEIDLVARDT